MTLTDAPTGHFGPYGGRFVPEALTAALDELQAAFDAALDAQCAAADRLRILSPAILVQDALHDIAGRSATRYRHYAAQVDAFHQGWQQFFFRRVFAEATMTPTDFAALPTLKRVSAIFCRSLARSMMAVVAFACRFSLTML